MFGDNAYVLLLYCVCCTGQATGASNITKMHFGDLHDDGLQGECGGFSYLVLLA